MGINYVKANVNVGNPALGIPPVNVPAHYESDSNRPGSHLNLGVIVALIKDVASNGAINEPEQDLMIVYKNQGMNATKAAGKVKKANFLSNYNYAVCHKIPYASFEKFLLKLMNLQLVATAQNPPKWGLLSLLLQELYGHGGANQASASANNLAQLVQHGAKQHQACAAANAILVDFDKCDENLYLGFASTNSSIGQNIDGHIPVLQPTTGPVTMTPRGKNLWQTLNKCEASLGLPQTSPVEVIDKVGLKWQMSSSVHGTKSQGTGYAHVN